MSRSFRVHDSNLNGPVPIGCSVPNVPSGRKTPSASSVPASAWNSSSAFGLAIENACWESAGIGFVRFRSTVNSSVASQLS